MKFKPIRIVNNENGEINENYSHINELLTIKNKLLVDIRCPGYFCSCDEVHLAITHNDYDLHEENYQYAAIDTWYIGDMNKYRLANPDKIYIISYNVKNIYGSLIIN